MKWKDLSSSEFERSLKLPGGDPSPATSLWYKRGYHSMVSCAVLSLALTFPNSTGTVTPAIWASFFRQESTFPGTSEGSHRNESNCLRHCLMILYVFLQSAACFKEAITCSDFLDEKRDHFVVTVELLNSSTSSIGQKHNCDVRVQLTSSQGLRVEKDVVIIEQIKATQSETITFKVYTPPGSIRIGEKHFLQAHLFVRNTHTECE